MKAYGDDGIKALTAIKDHTDNFRLINNGESEIDGRPAIYATMEYCKKEKCMRTLLTQTLANSFLYTINCSADPAGFDMEYPQYNMILNSIKLH